jgi:hypothetical protein
MPENERHFRGINELSPRIVFHRHALRPKLDQVGVFGGDEVEIGQ